MTIFCAIHFYNTSNIDILVTGLIITIGMIAFFTFIVYITKTIKYIKIISNIKNNNFRIEKNYAKEKYLSFGIPKVKLESRDIISISEQEFNKVKCENMHSIYYCVRVKPFEDEIFPFAANMYNLSPEYKDKLTNYIYNTKDMNLP